MTTAEHMATRAVIVCGVNGMPSKGQLTSDKSGFKSYLLKKGSPVKKIHPVFTILSSLTKAVITSSRADANALTTELSFCRGDGLLYKVSPVERGL